jgi:hypothetical protein
LYQYCKRRPENTAKIRTAQDKTQPDDDVTYNLEHDVVSPYEKSQAKRNAKTKQREGRREETSRTRTQVRFPPSIAELAAPDGMRQQKRGIREPHHTPEGPVQEPIAFIVIVLVVGVLQNIAQVGAEMSAGG